MANILLRKQNVMKNVLNEIKVLLQYPKQSYKLFFNKTTGAKSKSGFSKSMLAEYVT